MILMALYVSRMWAMRNWVLIMKKALPGKIISVNIGVIAQPGSNQIEIADEVYKRIAVIKKDMPADIIFEVGYDRSNFVRKAVSEVKETLFIAIGLVVLIIFLFFRSFSIAVRH